MSDIVVLNGPPSVGKSTVAASLRTLLPGTVAVSGDELRAFAPPDARAHLGGGATYRVAGALCSSFVALGAQRVVFDYLFLRAAHFAYFRDALTVPAAVHVLTLWAPLERVLEREEARARRPRVALGAGDCYREMAQNLAQMGEIIDTEASLPEQTAQRIHELLAGRARH